MSEPLYLFYDQPDEDRWFKGDRYPRAIIRRIIRGPYQPGGMMRWFLNLRAGLDQLGVDYRVNDYRGLRRRPGAWAHVVGQSLVIPRIPPGHPIIHGPAIADHPVDVDFYGRADIRLLLISCEWFKRMYERDLPHPVRMAVWPAGIDTDRWTPPAALSPGLQVLVYDKIRWRHDEYQRSLLDPILTALRNAGASIHYLRYGAYKEQDYCALLQQVHAMVFLCEHETQGFAYLQALSSGVPILAWDRGGMWQDPRLYPQRVKFEPVESVPYFDARCGLKFKDLPAFEQQLEGFLERVRSRHYRPRDYVVENLTLAGQARSYLALCQQVKSTPPSAR